MLRLRRPRLLSRYEIRPGRLFHFLLVRPAIIHGVAYLWPFVFWLWIIVYAGALVIALLDALRVSLLPGRPPISLQPVVPLAQSHPRTTVLIASVVVGVTLIVFAAHRLRLASWRRVLAPYVLARVSQLDPARYIPRYVANVYLWRCAAETGVFVDELARKVLRMAARRRASAAMDAPLGICVFGRPAQGKTRLAWEAMRVMLPGWTLVRWRHTLRPFDLSELRSRRIVLWLDDLHEFANQSETVILSDLPRCCAEAGIRLVIVATCRDGEEEARARRYLESLLERLTAIRLTTIAQEETDQLAVALAKEGVSVAREVYAPYAGTPGSLLLDLQEYRSSRYPRLPEEAKCVLRAMKLLRSARIFTYPVWRVRVTAIEIFGLAHAAWESAVQSLVTAGFLTLTPAGAPRAYQLEPSATIYLDIAVPDYLTRNAGPGDDWPWLQDMLERQGDGEALLYLGDAYTEQHAGVGPFLPTDPYAIKLAAVTCFRGALDLYSRASAPDEWAVTQASLAAALSRQAELVQGMLRQDLRRQAAGAYRAALEVFTRRSDPASWALTQYSLAELHQRRARDAVYAGEVAGACANLRHAQQYIERALDFYNLETDPARYRQVVALRGDVLDALGELGCDDDDGDERDRE